VSDDGDRKIPEAHAAELSLFYDAHAQWLFGHACLRTQRDRELVAARELAADLVQDTFVAAALSWETLRGLAPAQQRAWLRITLSNKETDHFRRRVALRRKQPELDLRYRAADHDPELQALAAVALEAAKRIIEGLPSRQRRIALMKWDDHMKESEIADELGCAPGTVAAQVHEIRRKLINGLGPYYPFASEDGEGQASR
jgi:RNA polymerase sigma factor (sigma-70 family)